MVRVLPGLFPGADAAPAGMAPREIQVESQQAVQRVARRTAGGQVVQAGQGAQRRAVVLRTRPASNVARAVRVDSRLAKQHAAGATPAHAVPTTKLAVASTRRL